MVNKCLILLSELLLQHNCSVLQTEATPGRGERLWQAAAAVASSLVSSVVQCWFFPFTNPSGRRKHPATNQMKGPRCPLANRDTCLGIKA